MLVETIKQHRYDGNLKKPGDVYDAKQKHAKALIAVKVVKAYTPEPESLDEAPEAASDAQPKRRGRPPKNTYLTRDMQAE